MTSVGQIQQEMERMYSDDDIAKLERSNEELAAALKHIATLAVDAQHGARNTAVIVEACRIAIAKVPA